MMKSVKRFLACFLIAAMLVGMTSFTSAEAALKTPGNCRFDKWTNSSFTACRVKWNSVPGANRYTVTLTYTDGSHYKQYTTKSTSYTFKGLADNHVYMVRVMASYVDPITGQTTNTSNFSNVAYIVPMPKELSLTVTNKDRLQAKLKWNPIYGSNGYNVFVTTDPYEDNWVWNQSTDTKATATSATVKKFRGAHLKKYTNYYVKIVTRRRRNGAFVSVSVPEDYYNAAFQLMFIR